MHLVDVATGMQLKSTGQVATCVPPGAFALLMCVFPFNLLYCLANSYLDTQCRNLTASLTTLISTAEGRRPGPQSPDASTRAMCMPPSMRSPGGGAFHSPSMLPPTCQPLARNVGSPGAHTPLANAPHTDINMYIAHMREHEYPQYMSFHMQQGMPPEVAHAAWGSYEHMKVESMMRGHT